MATLLSVIADLLVGMLLVIYGWMASLLVVDNLLLILLSAIFCHYVTSCTTPARPDLFLSLTA